jgi:2-desacetyl-2-hydroxyethyl bacteriochlorophyllide A dehydrogenase
MRKLVMTGLNQLELQEAPAPGPPGPAEVVIEVDASGLGISQLHILAGTTHPGPIPRVLGHEIAGRVTAAGSGVLHLVPGDFVVVNTLVGCGTCRQCLRGQESVCHRRAFIGMETDGGWADFVAVPADRVFRLPEERGAAEAVLVASALPSAYHAVLRAGVRPGDRVAVLGLGSIGILLCQVARAFGAAVVVGVQGHARDLGPVAAHLDAGIDVSGISDAEAAAAIRTAVGIDGADVVFESAGVPRMLAIGLAAVRTGGVLLAMGLIKGAHAIAFADYIHDFAMREIEIRTTYAFNNADFLPTIELYAAGRIDFQGLIAGEVAPEEVPALVEGMRREGTAGKRYAIRF